MPHRLRKIRKKRGSRTCGWGRVGQHRKSGQKGGKGRAGGHKHFWTYVVKYEPDRFGKHGFKSPKSKRLRINEINVGELEALLYKLYPAEKLLKVSKPLELDLREHGYNRLLGKGRITIPVIVKVESCTRRALEKVEAAGGKVVSNTVTG